MSETNGNGKHVVNEQGELLRKLDAFVVNELTMRQRLTQQMFDPRRNLNRECGYPETMDCWGYQKLYDREPIAARVVQLMPKECWKVSPQVYEDDDPKVATEFEQAWDDLAKTMRGEQSFFRDEEGSPIYDALCRLDIQSGIGGYGVMLLGFDDVKSILEMAMPVAGVEEVNSVGADKPGSDGKAIGNTSFDGIYRLIVNKQKAANRRLLYTTVFPESQAQITQWETNPSSPRYGFPVMYQLSHYSQHNSYTGTIGSPLATYNVHWTRIHHVPSDVESNEVVGVPRCQHVLNPLLDIRKVRGGSAEMYWQGAFPGITAETHPQLGGDVSVDVPGMREMFENVFGGLQRFMLGKGMTFKTLSPVVSPPNQQLESLHEAIAIMLGCPIRIFKGSERGEMSSAQDSGEWDDRIKGERRGHRTNRVLVPFVNRLTLVGVLPQPKSYSAGWDDAAKLKPQEKAQVAAQQTTALGQYVSMGLESLITPLDYLTKIQRFDDEEAQQILDNANQAAENDTDEKPSQQAVGISQSMGQLLMQVSQGLVTRDAALFILTDVYKVDPADAETMLPPEPDPNAPEQPDQTAQMISGGIGQVMMQVSQGMMPREAAIYLLTEVYKVAPEQVELMVPEPQAAEEEAPAPPAEAAQAAPGVTQGIVGIMQQVQSGVLTPEAAKVLLVDYYQMDEMRADEVLGTSAGDGPPEGWEEVGAEEELPPEGWEEIPTEGQEVGAEEELPPEGWKEIPEGQEPVEEAPPGTEDWPQAMTPDETPPGELPEVWSQLPKEKDETPPGELPEVWSQLPKEKI